MNAPSELRTSNPVTFTKEDSLNAKAIASASGVVTEGQICISEGDFIDQESDFEAIGNGILRYNGSSNLRVRISVLCDTGNQIISDLEANGIDNDWTGNCSIDIPQTACIIALRYA